MLFDIQIVVLGDVAPGSKKVVIFNYLGDKKIEAVTKSCSCTSAVKVGNKITATIDYADKKRTYRKNITISVKLEGENNTHILRVNANVKDNNN